MMKRLTWFVGGAVAGAASAGVAKRKVKAAAAELAPVNVARKARDRVSAAWHDGRDAMRAKERELKARIDGRAETLADHLDSGTEVFVDGRPVEPGKVVVLRDVRRPASTATAARADKRRRRA